MCIFSSDVEIHHFLHCMAISLFIFMLKLAPRVCSLVQLSFWLSQCIFTYFLFFPLYFVSVSILYEIICRPCYGSVFRSSDYVSEHARDIPSLPVTWGIGIRHNTCICRLELHLCDLKAKLFHTNTN